MRKNLILLLFLLFLSVTANAVRREYTDQENNVVYTFDTSGNTAEVRGGDYTAPGSPDAKGSITILPSFTVNGKTYTVTKISTRAFRHCYELTAVSIPQTVQEIEDWAFSSCTSLMTINFPEGITKIPYGCFWECSSLHNITLPSSLTSIDGNAFVNCGLRTVVIPKNVKTIGGSAFAENELTSVTLPEGLVSLGPGAFGFNYSLGNVALPQSLKEIGDGAFSNCKNMTSVTLPAGLTYIGNQAFHDIPNLETVVSNIEEPFDINDAFLISGRLNTWFFTYTEATLHIPAGTKEKYKKAKGWNQFHPMLEPETTAGEFVDAQTGVTYLYESDWPEAMVKRGTKTGCGSPNAFGNIIIKDHLVIDGHEYQVTEIGTFAFNNNWQILSATISSSVTAIGEGAFYKCSNLTAVTLPQGIKELSSGIFEGCSQLKSMSLPEELSEIYPRAFLDCRSLEEIRLPHQLTLIGFESFKGCTALKSFLVPKSVTVFGSQALAGCTSLESFSVEDGNPLYDSRDNCNGLVMTEQNQLLWGFKGTTIPQSVRAIGDQAFAYSDLEHIVIPPQIENIGYCAYYGSENVTSIELPETQPWIVLEAFRRLPNLKTIISKSPKPCNIEEVFDNDAYEKATVYIPKGLRQVYEEDEIWGLFQHIIEVDDINNLQTFNRKVVVEEGTGTWCQWCPRGIVGMREMLDRHPDTFIPIAVHANDAMQTDSYAGLLNQKLSFYPSCTMNRTQTFDPNTEDLEKYYNISTNGKTTAKISMTAWWLDAGKRNLQVNTTTNFAYDTSDDYRIAYVVTENNVGPYAQQNAYAGGDEGEMGGFENLPSSALIYHNHVARYISRLNGTHRTVPEEPRGGVDYEYSYQMELPGNVQNADNIEIIVLLINQETFEIENADCITADKIAVFDPTGIHHAKEQLTHNSDWYSMDGRRFKTKPHKKGIYVRDKKKMIIQ